MPSTVIGPPPKWPRINASEIWGYRDLLLLLVRRDIFAKYRQSVFGPAWAVLKPVLTMVIFSLVFGRIAGLPSDGVPYPLFCFAAILPWTYFSTALAAGSTSLVTAGALLKKVFFPRLILPLTSLVTAAVDLAIQLLILGVIMVYYDVAPSWRLAMLPVFILMCSATAFAVSLWLTTLNVKYRDIGHAVPFFVQAWMWLSPVVYSTNTVPEKWRAFYALNPLVGIIDGFRWSLIGNVTPDWTMLAVSMGLVLAMLVSGVTFFRKMETQFADII